LRQLVTIKGHLSNCCFRFFLSFFLFFFFLKSVFVIYILYISCMLHNLHELSLSLSLYIYIYIYIPLKINFLSIFFFLKKKMASSLKFLIPPLAFLEISHQFELHLYACLYHICTYICFTIQPKMSVI
jgi:hypothetical protein